MESAPTISQESGPTIEELLKTEADYAESSPSIEVGSGVSRVLKREEWSDTYDAEHKLTLDYTYAHSVDSPGCGAVLSIAYDWVVR